MSVAEGGVCLRSDVQGTPYHVSSGASGRVGGPPRTPPPPDPLLHVNYHMMHVMCLTPPPPPPRPAE